MRKLQITFEIPEDYEDVHHALIIEDMRISDEWVITDIVEIITPLPFDGKLPFQIDGEVMQRAAGTPVLINYNNEAGQDWYSVEAADDVGNWLESFTTLEGALGFITAQEYVYDHATGFRDTRYPY